MKHKNIFLKVWLLLAVVTICLCGLVFLVIQQDIRIGANDPQIQIAEDVSRQISLGQNPIDFLPPIKVELSRSLANYIMLFDDKGKLIASSAMLDGKTPILPSGVLASAKQKGEVRFTWQPKSNVRSAVVIDYYKGLNSGYVLVGRSIKEVENRIDNLQLIVLLGWALTLAVSLGAAVLLERSN